MRNYTDTANGRIVSEFVNGKWETVDFIPWAEMAVASELNDEFDLFNANDNEDDPYLEWFNEARH